MLASQTCSVQNPDLARVPTVEFIRAYPLVEREFEEVLASGSNPRRLHTRATGPNGLTLDIELKIEERVWVPRECLMELAPRGVRLQDSETDINQRRKETFSAWLARSYTRVELPDDFNRLFSETKIKKFFGDNIAKKHAPYVQGVYLDLRQRSDEFRGIYSPTQVAKFLPPYQLHVTVVVQNHDEVDVVEKELSVLLEKRFLTAAGNVSRVDVASGKGLDLTMDVVTIDAWTVRNLMGNIRFTDWDHLSSVDESDL